MQNWPIIPFPEMTETTSSIEIQLSEIHAQLRSAKDYFDKYSKDISSLINLPSDQVTDHTRERLENLKSERAVWKDELVRLSDLQKGR
jgi:hypothetical protein